MSRNPVLRRNLLLAAACLACLVAPLLSDALVFRRAAGSMWRPLVAFDFKMRCHEAECLLMGVDPFLVWSGQHPLDGYEAIDPKDMLSPKHNDRSGKKLLHVYPPWSMVAMIPFALLPVALRYVAYTLLEIAVVSLMAVFMMRRLARLFGTREIGPLVVAMGGFAFPAVADCLHVGNFGVLIAGAVCAALACHERKRDGWAGVFWAAAMVKPQIGLLFLLSLLVLRKWRTLAVTAGLLAALTLVAAVLCGRSPVEMVLSITKYNSADNFPGVGLVTRQFSLCLTHGLSPKAPLAFGLLVGGSVGMVLTRWYSRTCDVFATFLPTVLLSTVWAAGGWYHDHSLDMPGFWILGFMIFAWRNSPRILCCIAVVFLSLQCRELGVIRFPFPNVAILVLIAALVALGVCFRRMTPSACRPEWEGR